MVSILCIALGIVMVWRFLHLLTYTEYEDGFNKTYFLLPLIGLPLIILGLTTDPIRMLTYITRDYDVQDEVNRPNYWIKLENGNLYHIDSVEYNKCYNKNEVVKIGVIEYTRCQISDYTYLYLNTGPIADIGNILDKLRTTRFVGYRAPYGYVLPGQTLRFYAPGYKAQIPRTSENARAFKDGTSQIMDWPCMKIMALHVTDDDKITQSVGERGLEFRYRSATNGAWSDWFMVPRVLKTGERTQAIRKIAVLEVRSARERGVAFSYEKHNGAWINNPVKVGKPLPFNSFCFWW